MNILKKIIVLLLVGSIISFLGAMDADLPKDLSIQTADGQISSIPLQLARRVPVIMERLQADEDYVLPGGVTLAHFEFFKNLLVLIDHNQEDETSLLDTLRTHYNQQSFNNSDKEALRALIEDVKIPILQKMLEGIKIESQDGAQSCYVNRQSVEQSKVLSAMVNNCEDPFFLTTEGIPFDNFDGAKLLFAGDIQQETNLRKIAEALYLSKQLDVEAMGIDSSVDHFVKLFVHNDNVQRYSENPRDFCKQFECFNRDQFGDELKAVIVRKIKDKEIIKPLTEDMRTLFDDCAKASEVDYTDMFVVETKKAPSYYSTERTITVRKQNEASSIIHDMAFTGKFLFSPNKKFLFLETNSYRGVGILIDLEEHKPIAKKYNIGNRTNMLHYVCFSPRSEFLIVSQYFPGITYGISNKPLKLGHELLIIKTDTGAVLDQIEVAEDSVCEISNDGKYICAQDLLDKNIIINIRLLDAANALFAQKSTESEST